MKPITLHPLSVLAGLALAGLVFFASGAVQLPIPTRTVFVGEVPAEWWTYVEVTPSQSFTVHAGRRFVVTEWTGSSVLADGQSATIRLYGVLGLDSGIGQAGNGTRVVFEPGTILTTSTSARLWGYLEPVS